MPRYMVNFKANPSAWPSDLKQGLAITEKIAAASQQLVSSGTVKEVGNFSESEGFAIIEADSKAKVMEITAPFFPLYSNEIREIVSLEEGNAAVLKGLRAAVAMS